MFRHCDWWAGVEGTFWDGRIGSCVPAETVRDLLLRLSAADAREGEAQRSRARDRHRLIAEDLAKYVFEPARLERRGEWALLD